MHRGKGATEKKQRLVRFLLLAFIAVLATSAALGFVFGAAGLTLFAVFLLPLLGIALLLFFIRFLLRGYALRLFKEYNEKPLHFLSFLVLGILLTYLLEPEAFQRVIQQNKWAWAFILSAILLDFLIRKERIPWLQGKPLIAAAVHILSAFASVVALFLLASIYAVEALRVIWDIVRGAASPLGVWF